MPPIATTTVFDLVKSHIRLPINRDYDALKHVLRDWHRYSTQVPLQQKPTFPAELLITITRDSNTRNEKEREKRSDISSRLLQSNASAAPRSRRWGLWKKAAAPAAPVTADSELNATSEARPFVYRKVVPLHVWTSVLPWEMQRGLSFSTLELPTENSATPLHSDSAASMAAAAGAAGGGLEAQSSDGSSTHRPSADTAATAGTEMEDPYGVVTSAAASTPAASSPLARVTRSAAADGSLTSVAPAAPAMLFLSEVPATASYGIGFWSGAILQPIDVLFVAPTLPASVGPTSASFRQLRQQDGEAAVMDNRVSRAVLSRFFPLQEIYPTPSWSSPASSVTFRLHSFGHLDPLPADLHPCRLDSTAGRAAQLSGRRLTVAPDAPYASPQEAPRYIIETLRHTLQPAVAAALTESRQARRSDGGEGDVSIDIVLNLSDALQQDLYAKAQLCVEYVSMLEDAIAHYARLLSTDSGAAAAAADPLQPDGDEESASGGVHAERRVKVWLSEHESRWMTPAELRAAAAAAGAEARESRDDDRTEVYEEEERSEEEPEQNAESDEASSFAETDEKGDHNYNSSDSSSNPLTAAVTPPPPSPSASTSLAASQAARAVQATAAQPGGVAASRSISLQSPMLADETEGRPSYLAPSFVGRHESAQLQGSAVVLSADKLARYPQTHSHMPLLPPVDYELYDLCMRLGVGQQTITYHYHERILREWRAELWRRRQLKSEKTEREEGRSGRQDSARAANGAFSASDGIPAADVERMAALVRDRSLQLSPELVSLVEAVVAAA